MIAEKILNQINSKDILNIYRYGSVVYGTNTELSDEDFIVIIKDGLEKDIIIDGMDLHLIPLEVFNKKLEEHDPMALECLYLPDSCKVLENKDLKHKIDIEKLRNSFSAKASNSWVKAKKKLEVEKDFNVYLAKKSLFHSLRILTFGMQIASYGKIINYSAANNFWNNIKDNPSTEWTIYKEEFQSTYNRLKTTFRKLAPLIVKE